MQSKELFSFIQTLSNQFRRPLTTLSGTLELLNDKPVDDWLQNYMRNISTAASELLLLADNLLALGIDLQPGSERSYSLTFILEQKTKSLIEDFRRQAMLRRHTPIVTEIRYVGEKRRYRTDFFHFWFIISSLYRSMLQASTLHGHIKLTFDTQEVNDEQDIFTLTVSCDKLPAAARQQLAESLAKSVDIEQTFSEPFFQLIIAQSLAKDFDGKIIYSSENEEFVKEGPATLSISIPLQIFQSSPQAVEEEQSTQGSKSAKTTALVVEDDEGNRAVLCQLLSDCGYEVQSCGDGLEAVEVCLAGHFDIIFMDCELPGINGLQAIDLIRDFDRRSGNSRNFITMTASPFEYKRVIAAKEGTTDIKAVLLKPFEFEDLRKVLKESLN